MYRFPLRGKPLVFNKNKAKANQNATNGQRQKPRNRSTNLAALSTAVSNIKRETRPIPQVSKAPPHPKAMIRARDVWMQRKVRTYHKGTTTQNCVLGDVLGELGVTDSTSIKVLGLTAWNTTPQGQNSQFIFLETEQELTLSGVRVEATDFGTASSLAGVKINIPDTLSRAINGSNLTTTVLAKISGSPYAAATVEQQYAVDWHLLWNTTADQ